MCDISRDKKISINPDYTLSRVDSLSPREVAERSIIKKFRKEIWKRFVKGVNEFHLISPGDKIAVCLSGGKDSMLLAKCMQEILKHGKFEFELLFISMDPGYNSHNRSIILHNSGLLGVPIHFFESEIFDVVSSQQGSPCYLCARMRRGHLYKEAQSLGCNKIALGHHFDDVIETVLMGVLYGGQFQTMLPRIKSVNFEGMELIRPLYYVRESDVIAWQRYNSLDFIRCACPLTENLGEGESPSSKRFEVKQLIAELKKKNPYVESNIFRSLYNVNLDTVISYKKGTDFHHFLDSFTDE